MRKLAGWIPVILILGVLYYYFGETTVTATLDGEDLIGATVKIDDIVVGTTPYTKRLGLGHFVIQVDPPEGTQVNETWQAELFSMVIGRSFNAPFTERKSPPDSPNTSPL